MDDRPPDLFMLFSTAERQPSAYQQTKQ